MGGSPRCFEGLRSAEGRAGMGIWYGRMQLALCGFVQEE